MEEGGTFELPQNLDEIRVGFGYDTFEDGMRDIDVAAVLLDDMGNEIEAVFFGNLTSSNNAINCDSELSGEGEGDDEEFRVDLARMPTNVQQILFVMNNWDKTCNFQMVSNVYCRIIEQVSGSELCRYAVTDTGSETGLIVSRITREVVDSWCFQAIGVPCRGRTCKESLPQIVQFSQEFGVRIRIIQLSAIFKDDGVSVTCTDLSGNQVAKLHFDAYAEVDAAALYKKVLESNGGSTYSVTRIVGPAGQMLPRVGASKRLDELLGC